MHTRDALSFLLFACQWLALWHAAPLTGGSSPTTPGNRAEAIVKPRDCAISTENSLRRSPTRNRVFLARTTKPKPKPKSAPKIVPEVAKPVTDTVEL
ncbi:hypothetical protein BKA70DRAFT_1327142, partial [Coprinopsis sp. MPI-PUGE-AT-0042]